MFLILVSFTTVLACCCSFPPCTAMYSHETAHPCHACRSPPETTLLACHRYWSGLKINQQKGADVLLSAESSAVWQLSWVGQCTRAGTGEGSSDRAVTPVSALLNQMAQKHQQHLVSVATQHPALGTVSEQERITLRSTVKEIRQKRFNLGNTKHS